MGGRGLRPAVKTILYKLCGPGSRGRLSSLRAAALQWEGRSGFETAHPGCRIAVAPDRQTGRNVAPLVPTLCRRLGPTCLPAVGVLFLSVRPPRRRAPGFWAWHSRHSDGCSRESLRAAHFVIGFGAVVGKLRANSNPGRVQRAIPLLQSPPDIDRCASFAAP